MLALTTVFWSLSFPLVKSLGILQAKLIPGVNTWFNAGLTGFARFGIAAAIMVFIARRTLPRLTRSEIWEGLGLGFFAGGGIMLQTDGLGHTSASTSAFITQAFCIFVPIIVAFRDRALPGLRLFIALLLMILGVSILSNFNPRTFHLGRGEAETLLGAVFFAGQILWLERPKFSGNNPLNFSFVMFLTMSLISLPLAIATWQSPRDVITCYSQPSIILITLALVFFCTIIAFVEMNKWQPVRPLHRSRDHLRRRTRLREFLRDLPPRLDLPPLRHQLSQRNHYLSTSPRRPPDHLRQPDPPMEMEVPRSE